LSQAQVTLQTLQREVAGIAAYVAELRLAINALRAPEIAAAKLPSIRGDLDAVGKATRSAADRILDTAENILAAVAMGTLKPSDVELKMMELMEVCSFQDLSGQRLKRVTDALDAIGHRLDRFVEKARAANGALVAADRELANQKRNEERLTHGPGHRDALNQDAIDMLLCG
jgi:chemotaxis protein CheZ